MKQWIRTFFWRKTIDDLMSEMKAGKRQQINREEIELANAYELRKMPKGIRYPREGEIYESLSDVPIRYMTAHNAPFTGGGDAILPKGERIRIHKPNKEKPIGVYCVPLRYDELHEAIVPKEEQEDVYYNSYYFSIKTVELNAAFRLIDDE